MRRVEGPTPSDVALVPWPGGRARREEARRHGLPRLLLVDPDASPPRVADALEDWVRLPAADADVRARIETLEGRASGRLRPRVDDHGVLRYGDAWVALSPVEARVAAALAERWGAVAGRDALMRAAWPGRVPSRNALDVHVLRLRRRLARLGLEIRTVRSRGYLLQAAPGDRCADRRPSGSRPSTVTRA